MTELEKQLKEAKIAQIKMLAEQMVSFKFNEFKDYKVDESKGLPYLNAIIDILNKRVENAKFEKAELIKFDKLEADRKNLSPEELKQLIADQKRNDEIVDSFLATLDPRASLKGRLYAPNSIILRRRGSIGSEFSKNYPFGVLM